MLSLIHDQDWLTTNRQLLQLIPPGLRDLARALCMFLLHVEL